MRIIHPHEQDGIAGKAGSQFTGEVWPYLTMQSTNDVVINTVTFAPGSRTYWHWHEGGQILQVLGGRGLICVDHEKPRMITQGDTVWCPPQEWHWHGAAPDAVMSHTAISLGQTNWDRAVRDEEYHGSQ